MPLPLRVAARSSFNHRAWQARARLVRASVGANIWATETHYVLKNPSRQAIKDLFGEAGPRHNVRETNWNLKRQQYLSINKQNRLQGRIKHQYSLARQEMRAQGRLISPRAGSIVLGAGVAAGVAYGINKRSQRKVTTKRSTRGRASRTRRDSRGRYAGSY